jgi:hypothetical protein
VSKGAVSKGAVSKGAVSTGAGTTATSGMATAAGTTGRMLSTISAEAANNTSGHARIRGGRRRLFMALIQR